MSAGKSWHRRQAVQIVAQLPEDASDALMVLEQAMVLVRTFLSDDAPQETRITDFSASRNRDNRPRLIPSSLPK
jgi:hypothetical protein